MTRRCVARLLAVFCLTAVLALLCCETARAQAKCGSIALCKPYEKMGPACARNKRMNLRFVLQTARENNFTVGAEVHHVATYGFCPVVDQLSSFTLTGAPFLATSYTKNDTSGKVTNHLSLGMTPRYLSVYGFGASNSTHFPEKGVSRGTVLVAINGSDFTGVVNSVGVVTMLSLEIGLNNGLFNYIGASKASKRAVVNPNYNASLCSNGSESSGSVNYCEKEIFMPVAAKVVQPAKVGFIPTCNAKDICTVGNPRIYTCIGDIPGQKNCGVYRSDPEEIRDLRMTVLVSYYGTDSRRNVLTSGGKNPLNFVSFVKTNALYAIGDRISSLFTGNISVRL
ncbi:hypothetical protein CUR178_03205 [Leishmania enriettii]|uniref:Uncharacterized protein n=1 Tax=Leishmania enriettii TaxID=5663 RepID=A0A836KJU9_LEIEN|nr:hypothetical protein CUR178_03205 [Leishmania enriettii]